LEEPVSKPRAHVWRRRTLRTPARRSRWHALAVGVAVGALTASLAACGGESSSNSDESANTYPVKVVSAEFPAKQRLGETTLLRLGVRNTGKKTVPALTVTITGGGKEDRTSSLPFGYRDPSPEIAQPDRPVWVLAARYPKVNGSSEPGGAETANPKTFDFGPLKPGATLEAVWKLSAVKTGDFDLLYEVGAGLGGKAKADSSSGTEAGGSFAVEITEEPPETEVTDSGEVVEIQPDK
jgi:hypothetical protein